MSKPRRNPIDKQRFLEGNRQRWALLLILCAAGVLVANVFVPEITPEPYLTFLTMIGTVFILGLSLDSALKIHKQHQQSDQPEPYPTDDQGTDR
jgi:hypothetical protein